MTTRHCGCARSKMERTFLKTQRSKCWPLWKSIVNEEQTGLLKSKYRGAISPAHPQAVCKDMAVPCEVSWEIMAFSVPEHKHPALSDKIQLAYLQTTWKLLSELMSETSWAKQAAPAFTWSQCCSKLSYSEEMSNPRTILPSQFRGSGKEKEKIGGESWKRQADMHWLSEGRKKGKRAVVNNWGDPAKRELQLTRCFPLTTQRPEISETLPLTRTHRSPAAQIDAHRSCCLLGC